MKLGLQIPNFTWPSGPGALGAELAEVAAAADEAGFAYLGVMDHFFQIGLIGPPDMDMLEAYTTLGFMAGHTRRATLLTVITGIHYREPGLLAKSITTLDVLSGGRGMLGIGAGWNEQESRGLGFPFPPRAERFEMLEETLRFILQMWSDDDGSFSSKHIDAKRTLNVPAALSRPHPPIMIGGGGERKTLRLVARYAQACNLFDGPQVEHKLDVLRRHCAAEGRNYDEVTKTVLHSWDLGEHGERVGQEIDNLRRLRSLGVDAALGSLHGRPRLEDIERFRTEIIPAADAL
ncbi:MAG: LLM class F420-dependent oxidoreductase [Acidimicrobiaceae bacterium]|nr:LLM class F420-dependent oxidoreductase [Acidimicrobiaceae bacterium]